MRGTCLLHPQWKLGPWGWRWREDGREMVCRMSAENDQAFKKSISSRRSLDVDSSKDKVWNNLALFAFSQFYCLTKDAGISQSATVHTYTHTINLSMYYCILCTHHTHHLTRKVPIEIKSVPATTAAAQSTCNIEIPKHIMQTYTYTELQRFNFQPLIITGSYNNWFNN